MAKLIVSAGHFVGDPGYVGANGIKEYDLNKKILDQFSSPAILKVPSISLKEKIEYVNKWAEEGDVAVEFHQNSNNNRQFRGVEAYYAENDYLAKLFGENVAKALNIPFRGAIHDSKTFVGSLGWLRKLKCQSVLIEVGYMSNMFDFDVLVKPETSKTVADSTITAYQSLIPSNKEEEKKTLVVYIDTLIKLLSDALNRLKNLGKKEEKVGCIHE